MKTKYLFGAMAALMMAACSQDEVVSVRQDGIAYGVSAGTQTRAADSYCNNTLPDYFKVWAKSADGLYINGDKIVNSDGVWTDADGTRYWPDGKTLDFYAEVNGDEEFSFNDGAPTFNDFTVKDAVDEQVDLMYSVRKGQTKTVDKVQLNFRHALSQVCFRAKNNTKNMSVVIKGVSVGHLTEKGTFTFPAADTDYNYADHSDNNVDPEKEVNGGTWVIPSGAQYNKKYSVAPLNGNVTLAPGTASNLTCPEDSHENGFGQVLTLLPQTVAAWNPTKTGEEWNGAYFLVDLALSNITEDDGGAEVSTTVYTGEAAIPVNVAWVQGYRYIYTFVFDEGGNGGWTPDPENPKPVLTTIKYDVTVDDFIPVNPDGGDTENGGTNMDGDDETGYEYSTTLNLHTNDGTGAMRTVKLNSNESTYSFMLSSEYTPSRDGAEFLGWATAADATTAGYREGQSVPVNMEEENFDLYAVWQKNKTTITLSYDVLDGTPAIPSVDQTVTQGESATFTVTSTSPTKEGQYQFLGWSYTAKTGDELKLSDVEVQAGAEITISRSTTLYAIYGKTTPTIGGGGSGSGFDN